MMKRKQGFKIEFELFKRIDSGLYDDNNYKYLYLFNKQRQ